MAIKKLQNDFTTPEQSKRLLELGVPRWTAEDYRDKRGCRHSLDGILDKELYFQNFPEDIHCWSTGRLTQIYKIVGENAGQCISCNGDVSMIEGLVQLFEENVFLLDFSKLED